MTRLLSPLRTLSLASAVLLLLSCNLLAVSSTVFADDPCTAPAATDPGVNRPVGADAGTFTYQCDGTYAGQWTNPYYAYNPTTHVRTALYAPDYAYDCTAHVWTMAEWDYSAASGKFFESRVVASAAPDLPTNCPAVAAAPAAQTSGGPSNPTDSGSAALANTGPSSANAANNSITLNGSAATNTQAGMFNNLTSSSTTGNTYVVGNTTGGSAASGDATTIANVANLLQSATNVFGPDTKVFTANINGDVNGDFMFDPTAILSTGPASSNVASNTLQVNAANTNNLGASITNNIDVGATSGDAQVAGNTTGGDATSGNANAVANLMNVINSTVAAGQSFVGTININGNLNGDILLPADLLNTLLGSTGPSSTNIANNTITAASTTANNATLASTTNVQNDATSGNASVSGNTTGGSATSGNTNNGITLLNLTGSNVIGKDDLLVFVNVLGKWVGMIMDAPQGSTAAELGGGITGTGPNSSNALNNSAVLTANQTNNANLGITNNVNVHAKSGDATVTDNTQGGNARSGNANTAVNILNMEGSNLSLSDWFGVLFINVFGFWNGSFGVNTAAGDPVTAATGPTSNSVQSATHEDMIGGLRTALASFVPQPSSSTPTGTDADFHKAAVLGKVTASHLANANNPHAPTTKTHASYALPLIGFGVAVLILAAGERDRLFGRLGAKKK